MRLTSLRIDGAEPAALVRPAGAVPLAAVNDAFGTSWAGTVQQLLERGEVEALRDWVAGADAARLDGLATATARLDHAPLYRRPRKIWGIGLNYVEHAADLSETAPSTEPASFLKPDTSIIGPGDAIRIPPQSQRTTAEGELGVIIGRECRDVDEADVPGVVAGFTTIIDMTAEDILEKNPRYLTRSKSFDTFFSFGPHLVTPDEVDDVEELEVATVLNGEVRRADRVSGMIFSPWSLVAFHSKVMTLLPGDVISTGTPGAVSLQDGDTLECRISGFEPLVNSVSEPEGR